MLEACVDFIVSVVNSLILMFADSDSLAFLLRDTTRTNMAIAKANDSTREETEMARLESTITLFSLSGTTPAVIIWSLEVVCSISFPSNSVVVVGSFIVIVVVAEVVKIEPSVTVVGCVCASTSLGTVAFSSSTVGRGDVLAAIVVAD